MVARWIWTSLLVGGCFGGAMDSDLDPSGSERVVGANVDMEPESMEPATAWSWVTLEATMRGSAAVLNPCIQRDVERGVSEGTVLVRLEVGKDRRVKAAEVLAATSGGETAACVEEAMTQVRLPPSDLEGKGETGGPATITYKLKYRNEQGNAVLVIPMGGTPMTNDRGYGGPGP